jgi:hypothetical protein
MVLGKFSKYHCQEDFINALRTDDSDNFTDKRKPLNHR